MFFKKKKKVIEEIVNPIEGEIIAIEKVNDPMFSQKMLGDGFAVIPASNDVYSPVDGKVVTLFPTAHAIGIESTKGVEVLIHIGINTVELKGDHFKKFVEQGDMVKKGDKLISFDNKKIQSLGYDASIMVVITNTQNFKEIEKVGTRVSKNGELALNII